MKNLLTLLILISICGSCKKEPNKISISKNPVNFDIKVQLTYEIDAIAFSQNKESYFIDGTRTYKITNPGPWDIKFHTDLTRRTVFINGKSNSTDLGSIKTPKKETLSIPKGESITYKLGFNLTGNGKTQLTEALRNKDVKNINWSESLITLPPNSQEHSRFIIGNIYTEKAKWKLNY